VYKLHIQNEKVRINIALIIETIRRERRTPAPQPAQRKKTLSFALDWHTGLLQTEAPQYKLIEMHLDLDKREVRIVEKGSEQLFNIEEMQPRGQQVLSETCHYLRLALAHLHDIEELAHLELDPSMDEIKGRTLLHEAWHAIERQDAELILLNTMPGTYLFRKDRFAAVMEEILSAAKQTRIRCLTLTYLDPQGQVRDKTIVVWEDHWLFYDDDPTLSGSYFRSLEDLLFSLGNALKRPLPALKMKAS